MKILTKHQLLLLHDRIVEETAVAVAEDRLDVQALADWFRNNIVRQDEKPPVA